MNDIDTGDLLRRTESALEEWRRLRGDPGGGPLLALAQFREQLEANAFHSRREIHEWIERSRNDFKDAATVALETVQEYMRAAWMLQELADLIGRGRA